MDALDQKIENIEKRKEKLELQKKIIEEKMKRKKHVEQSKRFSKVGKLAEKTGLLELDDDILHGAFLEICSKMNSSDNIDIWKNLAIKSKSSISNKTPLSITFNSLPSPEEKKVMRDLSFRYNKFRNEFYGYGAPDKIRKLVSEFDCSVEVLEE